MLLSDKCKSGCSADDETKLVAMSFTPLQLWFGRQQLHEQIPADVGDDHAADADGMCCAGLVGLV